MSEGEMADPGLDQALAAADVRAACLALERLREAHVVARLTGEQVRVIVIDPETREPISDKRIAEMDARADEFRHFEAQFWQG